jgi:hypothetical protein
MCFVVVEAQGSIGQPNQTRIELHTGPRIIARGAVPEPQDNTMVFRLDKEAGDASWSRLDADAAGAKRRLARVRQGRLQRL